MSQTVYLVADQHGIGHRVHFAREEDAQAYAKRCMAPCGLHQSPAHYIVVPVVVWESLAERDAAPE